jgi:hypothetical protein
LIVGTVVLSMIALGSHILDVLQGLIVFGIFLSVFGVMALFFGSKLYNMFISLVCPLHLSLLPHDSGMNDLDVNRIS